MESIWNVIAFGIYFSKNIKFSTYVVISMFQILWANIKLDDYRKFIESAAFAIHYNKG